MREFKAQKLLGCIQSRLDGVSTAEPSFCFHTLPYSSNLFHIFGKHCVLSLSKDSSRRSSAVALYVSYVSFFFL